jgi:hypothetical protein
MSESNTRWLHELVVGSLLRGALAIAGLLPIAVMALVEAGPQLELLQVFGGLFVYAVALFLSERRGAPWPETALRLAVGGLVGAALGMFGGMSLEYAGEPWRAWEELVKGLGNIGAFELLLSVLMIVLVTEVIGAWFHVRARTNRPLPQVITGVLLTGLPTLFVFLLEHNVRWEEVVAGLCVVLSGGLVPLFVALGEQLLVSRWDPQAPTASRGEVRPQVAGAGLIVLGVLGTITVLMPRGGGRYGGNEASAIGALKTINTSQTLFREGDKDGNGTLDYAGSTAELSDTTLIDSILGQGHKQGYVFRVIHSAPTSEFLWMAAADPIALDDGTLKWRRAFVTNHAGVIYYRAADQGPVPLDPVDCKIPDGWLPIGK